MIKCQILEWTYDFMHILRSKLIEYISKDELF